MTTIYTKLESQSNTKSLYSRFFDKIENKSTWEYNLTHREIESGFRFNRILLKDTLISLLLFSMQFITILIADSVRNIFEWDFWTKLSFSYQICIIIITIIFCVESARRTHFEISRCIHMHNIFVCILNIFIVFMAIILNVRAAAAFSFFPLALFSIIGLLILFGIAFIVNQMIGNYIIRPLCTYIEEK